MKKWIVIVSLTACSGGKEGEESPEDHACEQRAEAGASLVATADPASAPSLALGEEPHTVALVDGAVGWVRVEVAEDTPALLFVGTADVVTALVHDGVDETLPTGAPNDICPDDIPEHFDLDLDAGSWQIGVGPAGVTEVWLMLSSAEGHVQEN